MDNTKFENATAGDRVYNFPRGWGTIISVQYKYFSDGIQYPIKVQFDHKDRISHYTVEGRRYSNVQELFWDEVSIEAPIKPLPELEVDTKLLVWNDDDDILYRRHFAYFKDGKAYCYSNGKTSWTAYSDEHVSEWDNYRVEGENNDILLH
jgi:hypothetical protein